jgi:prepilin signal peptidase PulO-like enzyme (type II secretory pathway)
MDISLFLIRLFASFALALFSAALWELTPFGWMREDGRLLRRPPDEKLMLRPGRAGFCVILAAFFALTLSCGPEELPALCPVWLLLSQLSLCDALYMALQDQWSLALALLGALRTLAGPGTSALLKDARASLAVLLLWLVSALTAAALKKPCPLGFGDAKLMAACAFLLGRERLILSASWAFIFAGLFCALLLALKEVQKDSRVSFGPFICLGTALFLEPHAPGL